MHYFLFVFSPLIAYLVSSIHQNQSKLLFTKCAQTHSEPHYSSLKRVANANSRVPNFIGIRKNTFTCHQKNISHGLDRVILKYFPSNFSITTHTHTYVSFGTFKIFFKTLIYFTYESMEKIPKKKRQAEALFCCIVYALRSVRNDISLGRACTEQVHKGHSLFVGAK